MHNFLLVLLGAGSVALAQNLGDYRVDQEFLEYVFDPVKSFLLRLFGKKAISRLELKGKAIVQDTYAKLVNLQKLASGEVGKVGGELDKLVGELKEKL